MKIVYMYMNLFDISRNTEKSITAAEALREVFEL